MADTPRSHLNFEGTCPDCGRRETELPPPLPAIGDDFDWRVRDYDGFRLFMMEQLLARFPERSRWTPADVEVVLVEVLAAVLDQLSDMLDRVSTEAFLETARRPESVRRLLQLIGYDAAQLSGLTDDPPGTGNGLTAARKLEALWVRDPLAMEVAREAGPRAIHTQRRMVTEDDYAIRLQEHPLAMRAHAWSAWSGSWNTVQVAVVAWGNTALDKGLPETPDELQDKADELGRDVADLAQEVARLKTAVAGFHASHGLRAPDWSRRPTLRTLLRRYIEHYRMAGQEVRLRDAVPVGISMAVSVRVASNYFQSEVRRAVRAALGRGPGGFFEPGRLRFGEDLHAGDIFEVVSALDGVETVCLNRFKRIGRDFPDQSDSGLIILDGLEIAVCDDDPRHPERGYIRLQIHGGQKG